MLFDGENTDIFDDCEARENGGFVVCGNTRSVNVGYSQGTLTAFSENGTVEWVCVVFWHGRSHTGICIHLCAV